jgi:hypothetical protein
MVSKLKEGIVLYRINSLKSQHKNMIVLNAVCVVFFLFWTILEASRVITISHKYWGERCLDTDGCAPVGILFSGIALLLSITILILSTRKNIYRTPIYILSALSIIATVFTTGLTIATPIEAEYMHATVLFALCPLAVFVLSITSIVTLAKIPSEKRLQRKRMRQKLKTYKKVENKRVSR